MSSVINYFKKKISKPFRRCVFDSPGSFVAADVSREKNRRGDRSSSRFQVSNLTITKSQIESTTDQSRISKNLARSAKSSAKSGKLRFFGGPGTKAAAKLSKLRTEDNIAAKASSFYCTPEHSPLGESHAVSCVDLKSAAPAATPIEGPATGEYHPVHEAHEENPMFRTFSEDTSAHMLYNTPVSSAHSSSTPSLSISARNRKINVHALNEANSRNSATLTSFCAASTCLSKTPSAPNSSPMSNLSDSMSFNSHSGAGSGSPDSLATNFMSVPYRAESSLILRPNVAPVSGPIKILLNDESNLNTMSLSANSNSMQQSTPFNENVVASSRATLEAKNAGSGNGGTGNKQTSIYSTTELETPQVSSIGLQGSGSSADKYAAKKELLAFDNEAHYELLAKKKCQRSNTTYTIKTAEAAAAASQHNKIIDFFNSKTTMSKAKSTEHYFMPAGDSMQRLNVKPLNQKLTFERTADDEEDYDAGNRSADSENEIEKIQDALFKDESYMAAADSSRSRAIKKRFSNESKDANISSFLLQSSISSAMSSVVSIDRSHEHELVRVVAKPAPVAMKSKLNDETHLVNKSVEKMRRSISMPGLNDNNTTLFSNVSKISMIKDIEVSGHDEDHDSSSKPSQLTGVETLPTATTTELESFHELDEPTGGFVRGESQARMSSNIKNMFNNVRKYQMNALNCLEKYHESQLNKLEIERNTRLLLNPNEKEQINAYFDQQKIVIEQRIYSNLCFITQNKSSHGSSNGSLNAQKSLSDMMSAVPNPARFSTESSKSVRQAIQQQQMNQQAQLYILQAQRSNGPKSIQQIKRPVIQQHQLKQQSKSRAKSLSGLKSNMIGQKSLLASKAHQSGTFNSSGESRHSSYSKFKISKINSTSNEEFERENFFMGASGVAAATTQQTDEAAGKSSTTQDFEDERTALSSIHDSNTQGYIETDSSLNAFDETTNNYFKRQLSLPFDKCGQRARAVQQLRKNSNNCERISERPELVACHPPAYEPAKVALARSNFASLAYSASKVKYYKRNGCGGMSNSSTFSSGSVLAGGHEQEMPQLRDSSFVSKNSSVCESSRNGSFLANANANAGPKLTSTQMQFYYLKNRLLQKGLAANTNEAYHVAKSSGQQQQQRQPQVSSFAQIKRLTGSPTDSRNSSVKAAAVSHVPKVYMKKETEV